MNPGLSSQQALPNAAALTEIQLQDAADKLPKGWIGTQAYTVKGAQGDFVLVPFADAGQTGADYSVWLGPLPQPRSKQAK
ncbi:MAG: hypothetical protein ABR915_17445 [Thermoguttaceae bacterium]